MAKKAAKSSAKAPSKAKGAKKPAKVAAPKKAAKPAAKSAKPTPKAAAKAAPKAETAAPQLKIVSKSVEVTPVQQDLVAEKPAKAPKAPKAVKVKVSAKAAKLAAAATEDESRWMDLHERYRAEKPQVYDMKATFEAGKPLQHKLLGWGWILSNENDRLEVLFKDGRRMLISNYNPNR